MKRILEFCKRLCKKAGDFIIERPIATAIVAAALTNILIYCLHMRSVAGGFHSMFGSLPHAILNMLILLLCFCVPVFFRRRLFGTALVMVLWLALGITDCVLLGMRISPLEAVDFAIVQTGIAIVTVYMTVFEIVLVVVAILAAIAALVFLFFKLPKTKPHILHSLLALLCVLLMLALVIGGLVGAGKADPAVFKNTPIAYNTYGFPYCFLFSVFDRGIERPDDYSEVAIEELLTELRQQPSDTPKNTPNVVILQLESVFDITRYGEISLSKDPIPNLRALRDESVFGLLTVPSIGAGTANTEFEVLTGLPIEFFGAGEYPYETILGRTACESIAYNLLPFGYSTHAIHNNTATFYDRHMVYANLGFEVFTGSEFMPHLEYNPLGWEKDAVLTKIIMDSLDSTEGHDLVFAVSVQAHGRYPQVPLEEDGHIITVKSDLTPEHHCAAEYYVNQLYEVDLFVGELIEALRAYPEETVLVVYGDHLPSLGIQKECLTEGDLFTSDYWIWSNRGVAGAGTRTDMHSYELTPALCRLLGVEEGLINKIHRTYSDDEKFLEMLRLAGYDMLYGDQLAFGGEHPYEPLPMRLGLYDFEIEALVPATADSYFLIGEGFTESTRVFLNGKQIRSTYVSETELYLPEPEFEEGDELFAAFVSDDLQKLRETERLTVTLEKEQTEK